MDTRDILLALDIYCGHDWDKMYRIIANKELDWCREDNIKIRTETEIYAFLSKGYKIVVIVDDEYPKKILGSNQPPFVIYYKGDINTIEDRYSYKSPEENPERMFIDWGI